MVGSEPIFALDWAPDAIIVTGLDGSVLHVNPRAEDLFGYRNDELTDKPLQLLIPEGVGSGELESSPLQHVSRTVVCAHRDGTRILGTARWRPAPAGTNGFVVFAIRDMAGEERPIEPGDVHSAEQRGARADLLSLFAHDVRESLQAIQSVCDTIQDRAPAEAATVSEIIGSVGRLLERLTRFSHGNALEPQIEPCSLGDLLGTLGRELTPLADRKALHLAVEPFEEGIVTDAVLFRELLHNLLANAIRYTDAGRIDVRCSTDREHVRVEVVDTGVGIARERLAAMRSGVAGRSGEGPLNARFDPSLDDTLLRDLRAASRLGDDPVSSAAGDAERAGDHVADDVRGASLERQSTGLGLGIVDRLARLLGCSIEVDSIPGEGSRFVVVVPRDHMAYLRRDRNGGD